jgi:hypothetical protein
MVPREDTESLFEPSAAEVQVTWQHGLAREDVEEAKQWISRSVHSESAGLR